jgi:hypothetical protein
MKETSFWGLDISVCLSANAFESYDKYGVLQTEPINTLDRFLSLTVWGLAGDVSLPT